MGGVSTPPVYRGAVGGAVGGLPPPKAPPTWGEGPLQGTVGGRLNTHELGLAKFSPACPVVADHVMINKIRFAAP